MNSAAAYIFRVLLILTNIESTFDIFHIWTKISNLHVYVWKSNLLFWRNLRKQPGCWYNFSLGQQNDFSLLAFILSRRCASSESYVFVQNHFMFAKLTRHVSDLFLQKPPFYVFGHYPGVGLQQPIDPGVGYVGRSCFIPVKSPRSRYRTKRLHFASHRKHRRIHREKTCGRAKDTGTGGLWSHPH